jgi:hypothetical protein
MSIFIAFAPVTVLSPQHPHHYHISIRTLWIIIPHTLDPLEQWTVIGIQMQNNFFTAMLGPVFEQDAYYMVCHLYHDHPYLPSFVAAPIVHLPYPPDIPHLIASAFWST